MDLPHIGDTFEDRYELQAILGQGGFATVFLAADRTVARDVVIKVLSPRDGGYSQALTARFLREARVFAELQDPHVITMFDFGQTDSGLLFMVFEHVDGRELGAAIREFGALSPDVVAHIVTQLLSALREAHGLGVLHRDIKPANVLVYEYDSDPFRIKLLDFGIAKDLTPRAESITRTGNVVGTLRYMAPEQLVGEPVGPDSDLYSLGLVASEMLLGRPLIAGESRKELLLQQVSDTPLRLPDDVAPPRLRELIERLMARDRSARYASASDAYRDLRALRRDLTASPPGPRASASPEEQGARSSTRWLLLAVVVLVVLAVLGFYLVLTKDGAQPPASPRVVQLPMAAPRTPSPDKAERSLDVGLRARDDGNEAQNSGCGTPPPFTGRGQLVGPGIGRSVAAYIPSSYDPEKPAPLVVMFHRIFRDGAQMIDYTLVEPVAEEHGFIVLAFTSTAITSWEESEMDSVLQMIERARRTLCVDDGRLYAIGDEAGASFAWKLACEIPLSAYAVTMDGGSKNCETVVPTARIRIYGSRDRYLPVEGGWGCNPLSGGFAAASLIRKKWKRQHGCDGPEKPWGDFPGGECRTWTCDRAPMVDCETDGGHHWPGSPGSLVPTPACEIEPPAEEFPFAAAIWKFFAEEGYVIGANELRPSQGVVTPSDR